MGEQAAAAPDPVPRALGARTRHPARTAVTAAAGAATTCPPAATTSQSTFRDLWTSGRSRSG
eukprot:61365-Chlamydomonas_euryale.AAC.1